MGMHDGQRPWLAGRVRRCPAACGWPRWLPGVLWLACFEAVVLTPMPVSAANTEPRDIAVDLQRERLEQWRRELNRRAAVLDAGPQAAWVQPPDDDVPCFVVTRFVLTTGDAAVPELHGLLQNLGRYPGACLGVRGIETLRSNLESRLVLKGYVTSTLALAEQNLGLGTLTFALQPGRVDAVLIEADAGTRLPAANALPLQQGKVLNLRDIEQALENLARLPSQASQFRIEPGELPGTSRVVLHPAGGPRWRGQVGAESTESDDYGPLAYNARFTLDAPFDRSDQIGAVASLGQRNDGGQAARQSTLLLSYSIPWGYHLLSVNLSHAAHQRLISGGVSLLRETGVDSQLQARWQWTAWRNQSARLMLSAGGSARQARTYLEDVELLLRRRDSSALDLGASGWMRHGCGDLAADLDYSHTLRLARDADFQPGPVPLPQTWRLEMRYGCQLDALFKAPWRLDARWSSQGVRQPSSGVDLVSLGGRWTVRGYTPRQSLTGEAATLLRHDLIAPAQALGQTGQVQPFLGLDIGRIHRTVGDSSGPRTFAGLAAGLRGAWSAVVAELVAARPLRPADGAAGQGSGAVIHGSLTFQF